MNDTPARDSPLQSPQSVVRPADEGMTQQRMINRVLREVHPCFGISKDGVACVDALIAIDWLRQSRQLVKVAAPRS